MSGKLPQSRGLRRCYGSLCVPSMALSILVSAGVSWEVKRSPRIICVVPQSLPCLVGFLGVLPPCFFVFVRVRVVRFSVAGRGRSWSIYHDSPRTDAGTSGQNVWKLARRFPVRFSPTFAQHLAPRGFKLGRGLLRREVLQVFPFERIAFWFYDTACW